MTPEERADTLFWKLAMGINVPDVDSQISAIAAAIRAAVAEEREACAKILDDFVAKSGCCWEADNVNELAAAIRARGADIPVEQMPVK